MNKIKKLDKMDLQECESFLLWLESKKYDSRRNMVVHNERLDMLISKVSTVIREHKFTQIIDGE